MPVLATIDSETLLGARLALLVPLRSVDVRFLTFYFALVGYFWSFSNIYFDRMVPVESIVGLLPSLLPLLLSAYLVVLDPANAPLELMLSFYSRMSRLDWSAYESAYDISSVPAIGLFTDELGLCLLLSLLLIIFKFSKFKF